MTYQNTGIKQVSSKDLAEMSEELMRAFKESARRDRTEWYGQENGLQNKQAMGTLAQALVQVATELRIREEAQKEQEGRLLPKPALGSKR